MKVCVIGGGPAGLMAALVASLNNEVFLLESNEKVGKKLLLTGNSRCNITNNKAVSDFIAHCGKSTRFMYSALEQFGPHDIINFFNENKVELKEEDNNRMFPKSDKASDILKCLLTEKVNIVYNSKVSKFNIYDKRIISVETQDGQTYYADAFILATGGKSFPVTGSDGSGYQLAKACGHTITDLYPVEVGLKANDTQHLQGLSFDSPISIRINGKVKIKSKGSILFTHFGLSGPEILRLSEPIINALRNNKKVEVLIHLHHHPLNQGTLRSKLVGPKRLRDTLLEKVGDVEYLEQINNEQKQKIDNSISTLVYEIIEPLEIEKAFVTAGGIRTSEVDPKTMKSKLIENLSFAGEILDIHGEVGGYNLTLALSSGYSAGKHIG